MDYRILGPLEVCQDGRTLRLGGDKQRALLAILLLHAGEVVSSDRLVDELWGGRPPATALKSLQVHVSRLRRALNGDGASTEGPADGVLVTRGHGYLMRIGDGELDLDRFRALVERGREALATGDPARAGALLREALDMWRGPPLADFAYEPFAQAAIVELEEVRLDAIEERVQADLALAANRELVGELRELVQRNPLRERLRGQLMLALYRADRQSAALEVYQQFRRSLSEQLGLEPGPALQRLEVAILGRDPSLELQPQPQASERGVSNPPAPPAAARPRARTRRLAAVVGGLAVAALAVVAIVAAVGAGGRHPLTRSWPTRSA